MKNYVYTEEVRNMKQTTIAKREAKWGVFFLSPSFILLIVFSLLPIAASLVLSFTDYNVLSAPTWNGIQNYIRMFSDPFVKDSLKNTLIYTVVTVPLQTVLSLALAAVLAELYRNAFGGFIKSALFVPVIASAALVGVVWSMLLSSRGPINEVLNFLGIDSVNWLTGNLRPLFVVSFVNVWKDVGYFMVIFYAGILNIPRNLYEAAQVDGASPMQCFWHITIPNLKGITYLVVTLGTIWTFQTFDLVQVMTGGGPGTATTTLVLTIYRAAFKEYRMGYASAIAILLLIFILLLSLLQKILLRGGKEE